MLGPELDRLPPTTYRTRARYGARLALALAHAGEVDRACEVARPMLVRAPTVNSATVRYDLRRLGRTLRRRRNHRPVREIMPLLQEALHSENPPSGTPRL